MRWCEEVVSSIVNSRMLALKDRGGEGVDRRGNWEGGGARAEQCMCFVLGVRLLERVLPARATSNSGRTREIDRAIGADVK